jgi:DNA-binding XRE family transcriptional regulator
MELYNKEITSQSVENHLQNCRIKMGISIREMREKKGYNQEQLAKIMNISRSTISKIESGKFNCSIDYLSRFSWFLQFEINFKNLNNE